MSSRTKTTATKEEARPALVPKLRFPEFRGTEGWTPVTLQKASTPVTERVGERKLTPVSISAGIGFVPQAEKFGRDISGNQYQLYTLVSDGDFVYNKGNSLKFPQGCVYQLQGWGQVAAPNVFICFRLKDGYSNVFFQNCFEQNMHGKQLKKHITSGARSNGLLNISKENFFGVEIPTPSPAEQKKIAECLSSMDELMAAQARKVDALKTHKKGLMQQLFPREGETQPRLRYPEFQNAGEWVVKPLGKLATRVTDKNVLLSQSRVLTNSAEYGVVDQGSYFDREIVTKSNLGSYYIVDVGDFVYNPRVSTLAPVGPVSRNNLGMGVMSPLYTVFRFETQATDFFAQLFKTTVWHPYLKNVSNSGARHDRMSITTTDFMSLPLLVPSPPEQQRIASCLNSLDALITAETQKLEALKTHKKGLMQQLFPALEEIEA